MLLDTGFYHVNANHYILFWNALYFWKHYELIFLKLLIFYLHRLSLSFCNLWYWNKIVAIKLKTNRREREKEVKLVQFVKLVYNLTQSEKNFYSSYHWIQSENIYNKLYDQGCNKHREFHYIYILQMFIC